VGVGGLCLMLAHMDGGPVWSFGVDGVVGCIGLLCWYGRGAALRISMEDLVTRFSNYAVGGIHQVLGVVGLC